MNSANWRLALIAAAPIGIAFTPALAQRPPSPEQRIAVLEQQLAASQASNVILQQRLDSIDRQLQQLVNQGEVNGHRVSEVESQISTLRNDVTARLTALEARPVAQPQNVDAARDEPGTAQSLLPSQPETTQRSKPKVQAASASSSTPETPEKATDSSDTAVSDPGEEAYSQGFRLWRDGQYDQAITALRAFIAGFPNHRRVSYARNLIGRSLLDKGQPRPAAEALLANYRSDPKGERAPDSLYYLGQALMQLNQPGQACKAYSELEDVYGASVRPDLKSLVSKGKADARCS